MVYSCVQVQSEGGYNESLKGGLKVGFGPLDPTEAMPLDTRERERERERERDQQKLVFTVGACRRVWADIHRQVACSETVGDRSAS